ATTGPTTGVLSILMGHGDGTYAAHVDFALAGPPSSCAVRDLDGDSILDVAIGYATASIVSVFRGVGNGTVGPRQDFAASAVNGVTIGDVTGDGRPDIIGARKAAALFVLPGHGDGTFGLQTDVPLTGIPLSVALSDLN